MNLYWQVYKNLEKEFLSIADVIHINDKQQDVYSMKIADLIIRTVVEIESITKELYLANGGGPMPQEEMFFDTVCMNHLNSHWHLEKKLVFVTAPSVYFTNATNKTLHPLRNANKRGDRSADWNKAYQAVKHNRAKELEKGSIRHLFHALAALYILNLYFKNDEIKNIKDADTGSLNTSFGSELFAVKIHRPLEISADGNYQKQADYDECVYILDHEAKSKAAVIEALSSMNDYVNTRVGKLLEQAILKELKPGSLITAEWVQAEKTNIIRDNKFLPIQDARVAKKMTALGNMMYDCILNKQQY